MCIGLIAETLDTDTPALSSCRWTFCGVKSKGPTIPVRPDQTQTAGLIRRASHALWLSVCQWSDKPWEIFTLSQRKSSQLLGQEGEGREAQPGRWMRRRTLELQGVNEKMRRQREAKAETPSSGFSLKPLVKVDEGCIRSPETDCITPPLINKRERALLLARTWGVLNLNLTCIHWSRVIKCVVHVQRDP